jgi:hypothetical protein
LLAASICWTFIVVDIVVNGQRQLGLLLPTSLLMASIRWTYFVVNILVNQRPA